MQPMLRRGLRLRRSVATLTLPRPAQHKPVSLGGMQASNFTAPPLSPAVAAGRRHRSSPPDWSNTPARHLRSPHTSTQLTRCFSSRGAIKETLPPLELPPVPTTPGFGAKVRTVLDSRAYRVFATACVLGMAGYVYWRRRSQMQAQDRRLQVASALRKAWLPQAKGSLPAQPEGVAKMVERPGDTWHHREFSVQVSPNQVANVFASSMVMHIPRGHAKATLPADSAPATRTIVLFVPTDMRRPSAYWAGVRAQLESQLARSHADRHGTKSGDDATPQTHGEQEVTLISFDLVSGSRPNALALAGGTPRRRSMLLAAADVGAVLQALKSSDGVGSAAARTRMVLVAERTAVWPALYTAAKILNDAALVDGDAAADSDVAKSTTCVVAVQPQSLLFPPAMQWWAQLLTSQPESIDSTNDMDNTKQERTDWVSRRLEIADNAQERNSHVQDDKPFWEKPVQTVRRRRRVGTVQWTWESTLSELETSILRNEITELRARDSEGTRMQVKCVVPANVPRELVWDFGSITGLERFWQSGRTFLEHVVRSNPTHKPVATTAPTPSVDTPSTEAPAPQATATSGVGVPRTFATHEVGGKALVSLPLQSPEAVASAVVEAFKSPAQSR